MDFRGAVALTRHAVEIVCVLGLMLAATDADAAPAIAGAPVTHSIRGVVKSVTATTLVLSRPHHRGDLTFELQPSTKVDGPLDAGLIAAVRYVVDHSHRVATAVAVTSRAKE